MFPTEVQFGHAGAKSGGAEKESAEAKNRALRYTASHMSSIAFLLYFPSSSSSSCHSFPFTYVTFFLSIDQARIQGSRSSGSQIFRRFQGTYPLANKTKGKKKKPQYTVPHCTSLCRFVRTLQAAIVGEADGRRI
jgi:hypothetical protein